MMQRAARFLQREPTLWGPFFLLCTIALTVRTAIAFDLWFVAALGLFLSACWRIRGFCYSLILLSLTGLIKHLFFTEDHLWLLGIESSLTCAFFITAIAFEQGAEWIASLHSQIETRKATLENLEEELSKAREVSQEQQIAFQEKVAVLQKDLEETQSEHSSLLILNEVLRKNSARHLQERDAMATALREHRQQQELLREERDGLEAELARLKKSDALVLQNQELMQELNQARLAEEQTHLINETLTRLHVKETLKAKEAVQEAFDLKDQLRSAHERARAVAEPLEKELKAAQAEIKTLRMEFDQEFDRRSQEAHRIRGEMAVLSQVREERHFLKERLEAAQRELELLQESAKKAPQPVLQQSPIEPLYLQLKKQFEEKTQVLHETRSQLFKTDTELQKLRMEYSQQQLTPWPKELDQELEDLVHAADSLDAENRQLEELITLLLADDAAKRKKKVKMAPTSTDQEIDFLKS